MLTARRPTRQACFPFCYAALIGFTCVLVIAGVTAGMGKAVTEAWIESTIASLMLKWMFADPLGILCAGAIAAKTSLGDTDLAAIL